MFKGIILFLLAWLSLLAGLHYQNILQMEIDLPSLMIVPGGVILLLYMSFSLTDMGQAIGFVLRRKSAITPSYYLKLDYLFRAAGDYSLYCGIWGLIIGLVLILQTLNDPGMLGTYFSVVLITVLYGFAGKLLSILAGRKLELCTAGGDNREIKPRKQPLPLIIGILLFAVITVLGIQVGGSLITFIDTPVLLVVPGGAVFTALLFVPWMEISSAFQVAFSSRQPEAEESQKAARVFSHFNDIVASVMFFAVLAGLIVLPVKISDPSTMGPILAFIFLCIFYGIGLLMLIRGFYCIVLRKLAALNEQLEKQPVFSASLLTGMALFAIILSVASLYVSILDLHFIAN